MGVDLSERLVPDGLWELVAPLLPSFNSRPQGGGTAPRDERAVFTAVVYVLTSGCAWRHLPETFGVSPATRASPVHRVDPGGTLAPAPPAVLDELGARGELDWASAIVDAARSDAEEAPGAVAVDRCPSCSVDDLQEWRGRLPGRDVRLWPAPTTVCPVSAQAHAALPWDLTIVDEAHCTAGDRAAAAHHCPRYSDVVAY